MRSVSDKGCREYQNTFRCGIAWQSQTGHRWQYNKAHVLCVLNN